MSPYTNKTELDNNLDNILEDLQNSISRPGSAMGQTAHSHYNTHREVQYLNPVNATTVLRERSLSPNTSGTKTYKTTRYEYSTLDGGRTSSTGYNSDSGNFSEINKLDSLLSDLEQERGATLERNKSSASNIGIDSGLLEPGTKVIKTTTTYTTKKPAVQRELVFDSPEMAPLRTSRHRSPGYERIIETTTTKTAADDGHYGGINQRTLSPTNTGSRTERYITETRRINNEIIPNQRTLSPTGRNEQYITETRTINNEIIPTPTVVKNDRYYTETRTINNEIIPAPVPKTIDYNEVVRVENSVGPTALQDIQLSDDILPKPKTKVTTTVRTYTYEIPEPETTTQTIVYKNQYNSDNTGIVTYPPERDPPKNTAVLYKTERTQRAVDYYPNQPNQPHDAYPTVHQPHQPLTIQEVPQQQQQQPPQSTTHVYRYDITNTTNTTNTTNPQNIPPGGITVYPPPPTQTTIVYKTDTHNVNQKYRSPTPTNYYPDRNGPGGSPYPSHPPAHPMPSHPADPSVIVYKHTTTTNTRNIISPRPETEPLLRPFPVEGPTITEVDGNPPKHLHDLMATFGDTVDPNYQDSKRVQIAEKPFEKTSVKEKEKQSTIIKAKDVVDDKDKQAPSKNVQGPPVYYPPNHEMFLKKEESSSGYRSQGGYARAKGKYEYEASSKSKSSSKTSKAVVPVCLPLCCAMPCTIM
jgi:hypothetical protein